MTPERGEWRRFWKVVISSTVVPLGILLGVLEWFGWDLGETYTPAALVRAWDEHPDMVWMGIRVQAHARLKLAEAAHQRADVLIMGQSRLGQVRARMFAPYTCYNLARVSWPFDTYVELLRRLPADYRPKVILFNADFFMFSDKYEDHYRELAPVFGHELSEHLIQVNNVATQTLQHPSLAWRRADYTGRPARGISALRNLDGFFKDGSERSPQAALAVAGRSPEDLLRPTWKEYVTGGEKMDDAEMAALKEFVELGRAKGIPMIAVQMPMYGPAVRLLEKDSNYRILQDYRDHVAHGYFDRLGIPFFDYMSFPPYTENYRYFFDAVHPGEALTAAVIAALGSEAPMNALLPRLDVDDLRRRLDGEKDANQHIRLYQ